MRGSVADVINMNFESRNSRESVMQNTNRNNGYSKPFAERQHSNTRKPNNGNVTCYKCKESGHFAIVPKNAIWYLAICLLSKHT